MGDTLKGKIVAYNYFGYSEPSNEAEIKLDWVSVLAALPPEEYYPN